MSTELQGLVASSETKHGETEQDWERARADQNRLICASALQPWCMIGDLPQSYLGIDDSKGAWRKHSRVHRKPI